MSLFVMALTLTSCGSDDSGDSGGGVSSINLTSSTAGGLVGDSFTFTVRDNNNNNVTADAVITADGTTITSMHAFAAIGVYSVVANYSGITSNTLSITVDQESSITISHNPEDVTDLDLVDFTVTNNLGNDVTSNTILTLGGVEISNPYQFTDLGNNVVTATYSSFTDTKTVIVGRGFTKKILLEDYTGTWCQFCPGAAAAITNVKNNNDNIFAVGYHVGVGSYPDPMQISETAFFANQYGVNAFPTVFYDGPATNDWNYPSASTLNTELDTKATTGLALDAAIVGGMLNVEVQVAFNEIPSDEIKLMLYIIEDNVTTSSAQSGSSQGVDYVHRDVLRDVYTNQLGDVIPVGSISLNSDYTRTFTGLALPANIDDMSELKVIAFVRKNVTGTKYEIMNVQEVHMGSSIDFD